MPNIDTSLLIFIGASLINVILNTMKSILTIKASRRSAALINAITFMFYTGVLKLLTGVDFWPSIVVTGICNFVGVYIADWLLQKFKKDVPWMGTIIVNQLESTRIADALDKANIRFHCRWPSGHSYHFERFIDIYTFSQEESSKVALILKPYSNIKYAMAEADRKLY